MKYLTDPTHRALAAGGVYAVAVIAVAFAIVRLAPPLGTGALPPLGPTEAPAVTLDVDRAASLDALFDKIGYAPLRSGRAQEVPPLLLRVLPRGFGRDGGDALRKRRFIGVLLPIVLRVNRIIADQRALLERLERRSRRGGALSAREWRWLGVLAELYRTEPDNWPALRRRVAPIPPSLAIAQAAAESGWGSSRFASEGNALFGQWSVTPGRGLKPARRDAGKTHRVKAFNRLIDSVWDYVRNLNSNGAYRELRGLRSAGNASGQQLAAGLEPYSQQGPVYVALIRRIIAGNGLARLDRLKLARRPPPGF
jgi:Bax protein